MLDWRSFALWWSQADCKMPIILRHNEIMEAARETGSVTVDGLAERFGVTPQTIRRDLNELCGQGLLSRTHGGALLGSGVANVGYETRRDMGAEVKTAIAEICAEAIPDGSSLFINIGTTTEAVARALLNHRELLVITNNINVATILVENPNCDVIVAGGMLRRADRGLVGEATTDFIKQFKVDFAVVGASGIDEDGTLLDFDYREVRVSRAIMEYARLVYLVADQTKLGRSAPVRIGGMDEVDVFFTDRLESPPLRQICAANDVDVREADAEQTPADADLTAR